MSEIKDYPKLEEWLDRHNARFCYSLLPRTEKEITPSIQAWKVNGAIVLVVLYPRARGFSLFTELDQNDIAATLADAERRVCIPSEETLQPFREALARDEPEYKPPATPLEKTLAVYFRHLDRNRSSDVDLDDRIEAKKAAEECEQQLRAIVGAGK